jgi:hypothetical protein
MAKFIDVADYSINLDHVIYVKWHDGLTNAALATIWLWPIDSRADRPNVIALWNKSEAAVLRRAVQVNVVVAGNETTMIDYWHDATIELPDGNGEFIVWCELRNGVDHSIVVEEYMDILSFDAGNSVWFDQYFDEPVDYDVVVTHWTPKVPPEGRPREQVK